ncbi:glutamyl-tRNA amidotransferase [Ihubacter sp. mB4P-1]|uniref:glutamyl-tRNA amidotransferase n=1 Tax=Ihubacter sp. mB4P-1 TaxID=3242370 RepID=UPI003C7C9114
MNRQKNIEVVEKKNKRNMKEEFRSAFFSAALMLSTTGIAFAAPSDPIAGINNLSKLISSIISAVGGVILLWSAVQLGIAVKKHDPAATSEAFLGIAAGLIIACAPWVVNYISGSN